MENFLGFKAQGLLWTADQQGTDSKFAGQPVVGLLLVGLAAETGLRSEEARCIKSSQVGCRVPGQSGDGRCFCDLAVFRADGGLKWPS